MLVDLRAKGLLEEGRCACSSPRCGGRQEQMGCERDHGQSIVYPPKHLNTLDLRFKNERASLQGAIVQER